MNGAGEKTESKLHTEISFLYSVQQSVNFVHLLATWFCN